MFGLGEPRRDMKQLSHEGLIARSTRLCQELRSKVLAKHGKGGKKRKRECVTEHPVLVNYPGSKVLIMHAYRSHIIA